MTGAARRAGELGRALNDRAEREIEDLEALKRSEVARRGVAIVDVVMANVV